MQRLRKLPGFEAALVQRAGERIRHAIADRRAGEPANPFAGRARDLIARPLVTCEPGETVRAAAQRMREQQVSSVVVTGEPLGSSPTGTSATGSWRQGSTRTPRCRRS